jgi:predicted nucleic acid-binding protein/GNAT superfamily N-acetyltransferase
VDVHIYDTLAEVAQFAATAGERADSQKDALGFLPRAAYTEAAAQGKLYVATVGDGRSERYAGHILFGGRFPHLKVFQVYVEAALQGKQIGRALVEKLASYAEQRCYLTMSARVADDLPANAFWEQLGFAAIRRERGGATTGRQINIRLRELETPTLFSGSDETSDSDLLPRWEQPVYLLDVNVFLDVVKDRERAEAAKRLITAAMSGILSLFVTNEFIQELSRAAGNPHTDPALLLAGTLPQFPDVPPLIFESLKEHLAALVFPGRREMKDLRRREVSDLLHLATTIHHSAAGFVTSDEAILRKRDDLRSKYHIDVVGPAELAELYIPSQWTPTQVDALACGGTTIEVAEIGEHRRKVGEAFLRSCSWSDDQIRKALAAGQSACPRHRVLVCYGESAIAFASWGPPRPPRSQSAAWLAIAPLHPMGELASDVLVERMARDICATRPACALLQGDTRSRYFRSTAVARGFVPVGSATNPSHFEKLCAGGVLSARNWAERNAALAKAIRLMLPERPPGYCGPTTVVEYSLGSGAAQQLPLSAFEVRFGPVILLLPGRPVIVVPIQRAFADQLLGTSDQFSLLPQSEASMWQQKLYLCSPRALAVLAAGAIVFFYESKRQNDGRGAIVAIAQIVRTAIRKKNVLDPAMTRRGVLMPKEIEALSVGEDTALVYFSQIMPLKKPVPMARLRTLGCMDRANFVTARRISEAAACAIIEEGQPHVQL